MRARKTREQWLAIVDEFDRSDETAREFCARHGVTTTSLTWWRWRLRRAGGDPVPEQVRLVPVHVVGGEAPDGGAPLTIVVAGFEMRIAVGTDVSYVASLLTELRSRC